MNLPSKNYQQKVKGFNLAFNTREILQDSNRHKYIPEGTAEEIRQKA